MGAEDGGSRTPYRKSSPVRNGGSPTRRRNSSMDPSNWKSYNQDMSPQQEGAVIPKFDIDPDVPLENMATLGGGVTTGSESESDHGRTTGLIIGDELLRSDPSAQDEMQRKKERIMMQSLRRKQQAEENRIKAEDESRKRREDEKEKEEEKMRKKEEEKMRRDTILEQHRLKKDQEKAEDEVSKKKVSLDVDPI